MSTSGGPAHYEIRVEGILDTRWAAWFGGLHIVVERPHVLVVEAQVRLGFMASAGTMAYAAGKFISGSLADQPELHGLLTKIRDLGLCLISVRRLDPD